MLFKGKVGQFCFLKHLWIGYQNPDPPSCLELIGKLTSGVSACGRWWPSCDRWGLSWGLVSLSHFRSMKVGQKKNCLLTIIGVQGGAWGPLEEGRAFLQSLTGLWLRQSYRLQGKAYAPQTPFKAEFFSSGTSSLYMLSLITSEPSAHCTLSPTPDL